MANFVANNVAELIMSYKPKYCILRGKTYHTRMVVPKDVRELLQQTEFSQSLETADPYKAEALASGLREGWKDLIKSARLGGTPLTPKKVSQLHKFRMDWISFSRQSTEFEIQKAEAAARGDYTLEGEENPFEAVLQDIQEVAIDKGYSSNEIHAINGEAILFEAHLDDYLMHCKSEGKTNKTLDEIKGVCSRFINSYPYDIGLNTQTLRSYLNSLNGRSSNSDASITTKNKVKTHLKRFFQFCGAKQQVADLSEITYKTRALRKANKFEMYSDDEVAVIHEAILKRGKDSQLLNDLCTLAQYTGARIEELCNLKANDIEGEILRINGTKTLAAKRKIPIHQNLIGTLERLAKTSTDGYLLSNLTTDKYNKRSGAIGKKFGRIKKELEFSERHGFHSFRATFIQKLRNMGCPEELSAQIAGQENSNISYGHYADRTTPEVLSRMKHWINLVSYSRGINPK